MKKRGYCPSTIELWNIRLIVIRRSFPETVFAGRLISNHEQVTDDCLSVLSSPQIGDEIGIDEVKSRHITEPIPFNFNDDSGMEKWSETWVARQDISFRRFCQISLDS